MPVAVSALLCMILLCVVASQPCSAAEPQTPMSWGIDSERTLTVTGSCPDFEKGTAPWWGQRDIVEKVVVGGGVASVGNHAFHGLPNVKSAELGPSVKTIGEGAFSQCGNLTSVHAPDGLLSIGGHAFEGCGLTAFTIPPTVRELGPYSFAECPRLGSVSVPDGVLSVGAHAFENCPGISDITLGSGLAAIPERMFFGSAKGGGSNIDLTIPANVRHVGAHAFGGCDGLRSLAVDPGVERTLISDFAFADCGNLETVNLPGNVSDIGVGAFQRCFSLATLGLGEGLESIDNGAFYCGRSGSLTAVAIPSTVSHIGLLSLKNVSLASISVDAGNAHYASEGGVLFNRDKTMILDYPASKPDAHYRVPESVELAQKWAFLNSLYLETLSIGKGFEAIEKNVFQGCAALREATIDPDNPNLRSHGGAVFDRGMRVLLTVPPGMVGKFAIPDSVSYVSSGAFKDCSLISSVTMGDRVSSIGDEAFCRCKSLRVVTIPKNVVSIGNYAFEGCPNVVKIYFESVDPPHMGRGAFSLGTGTEVSSTRVYSAIDGEFLSKHINKNTDITYIGVTVEEKTVGDKILDNPLYVAVAVLLLSVSAIAADRLIRRVG